MLQLLNMCNDFFSILSAESPSLVYRAIYCVLSQEKCGVIPSLLVKPYQIQFGAALFSLIQAPVILSIQSLSAIVLLMAGQ